MVTGQYWVQTPQPVHFSWSMKRGCCRTLTRKSPACPEISWTSALVMILMLGDRPASTSFGARIQIAQSLVGKVLSSPAMMPPMADDLSTR
jgi:hypothetical protein